MINGRKISELDALSALLGTHKFIASDGSDAYSVLFSVLQAALVPPGTKIEFCGTSAPAGFLACDGSAVSRTTYAALFTAIGTTWGAGDGSTTFTLPDFRGAFTRGSGTHGTATMGNGQKYSGPAVGSSENDQMQGHNHIVNYSAAADGQNSFVLGSAPTAGAVDIVTEPTSDGTNGTPRAGDETRPFAYGVCVCIKY